MAGSLDGSRFIALVADELKVPRSTVTTYVLGSHGDTMVPLVSKTLVGGKPIASVMQPEILEKIVKRTCDRGAEIVSLLGTGSAYYSPSAAVFKIIEAILGDKKEVHAVSTYCNGEYGLNDVFVGVPCTIGKGGIEGIVTLDLSEDEERAFRASAKAIKGSIELL